MWNHVPLTWPQTASKIQSQSEAVTDKVEQEMIRSTQKLIDLKSDANFGRHSLSEEAQAVLMLRNTLDELCINGTVVSATPYHFEVGERLESGCYLSPANAIQVLCDKLRDLSDIHRPKGQLYAIAIMLTSHSIEDFSAKLNTVSDVLTLPDWCQCARQTQALVTNERDKLHQPAPIIQPRFKPFAFLNASPFSGYKSNQASQVATIESLASDATNVIDKLARLGKKRATVVQSSSSAIEALKVMQGSIYSMSLSGSTESMATILKQAPLPNKHPLTVASLIISDRPVTFFRELLCSH
ncbi:hypothetical protein ABXV22_01895 [Vibrio rotiferianus]|uniref:hypothetical protein n=1 Tax=Vibrio rotiferianus TaxID=190895 RepID=UPI003397DF99